MPRIRTSATARATSPTTSCRWRTPASSTSSMATATSCRASACGARAATRSTIRSCGSTSGGRTAVFAADLMPTAAHVDVAWIMGYDLYPMDTLAYKKRVPARGDRGRVRYLLRARPGDRRRDHPGAGRPAARRARSHRRSVTSPSCPPPLASSAAPVCTTWPSSPIAKSASWPRRSAIRRVRTSWRRLRGRRVAFLARHGAGHRLLPSELNFRANIYGFKTLGVEWILSASAVGSLREDYKPLDIVVPDSVLRPHARPHQHVLRRRSGGARRLRASVLRARSARSSTARPAACGRRGARGRHLRLHGGAAVLDDGRVEAYRAMGFDIIGMTNLQEAKLAREAEICYTTLALVTDYDCWHPGPRVGDGRDDRRESDAEREDGAADHRQRRRAAADRARRASAPARSRRAIITRPDVIPAATRSAAGSQSWASTCRVTHIVVTGSIAFDYLMSFPGKFTEHFLPEHFSRVSLSFLVDSMDKRRGGCAPNIAYTLALLGERPQLMGDGRAGLRRVPPVARGGRRGHLAREGRAGQVHGVVLLQHRRRPTTRSRRSTPARWRTRPSCRSVRPDGCDLAIISPNDPAAMTQYAEECRTLGIPFIFDPGQQCARMSGRGAAPTASRGAAIVICNDYEFELIRQKTGLDEADDPGPGRRAGRHARRARLVGDSSGRARRRAGGHAATHRRSDRRRRRLSRRVHEGDGRAAPTTASARVWAASPRPTRSSTWAGRATPTPGTSSRLATRSTSAR